MSRENVEQIRRLYDAMAEPGRAGVLELFDPDVVLTNTADSPEQAPYVGFAGLAEWVRSIEEAMGECRIEADEIIDVDAERVIVVGRVCGTGPVSGLPVEVPSATVFTLRDGKIVSAQGHDTRTQALEAVGRAG